MKLCAAILAVNLCEYILSRNLRLLPNTMFPIRFGINIYRWFADFCPMLLLDRFYLVFTLARLEGMQPNWQRN